MKPDQEKQDSKSKPEGELSDQDLEGVSGGALNAYVPNPGGAAAAVDMFSPNPGGPAGAVDAFSPAKVGGKLPK